MNNTGKFFSLTNIAIITFAVVVASVLYIYAVNFTSDEHWQDYLINIAASCFAIVPTVVAVNYLSDERWSRARNASSGELQTIIDQHLRGTGMLWGYMSGAGDSDQTTRSLTQAHRKKYVGVIESKMTENEPNETLYGFGPGEWSMLKEQTANLSPLVPQFLSLHTQTISPELYGRLLELQTNLQKLSYILDLEDGALTSPYKEWTQTRQFASSKYAHAARDRVATEASAAFHQYLSTLMEFGR